MDTKSQNLLVRQWDIHFNSIGDQLKSIQDYAFKVGYNAALDGFRSQDFAAQCETNRLRIVELNSEITELKKDREMLSHVIKKYIIHGSVIGYDDFGNLIQMDTKSN